MPFPWPNPRRPALPALAGVLAALLVLLTDAGPVTAAGAAPLTTASKALDTARRQLPKEFVLYDSRRYVMLSDADPAWTRSQIDLLERSHHQFQRFCRRHHLQPQPLRHKLVAVVFEHRSDYRRFAARHDDVPDASLAGYYSPRHDRVVFYNVHSNPSVEDAQRKLTRMESDLTQMSRHAQRARREGEAETSRIILENLALYEQQLQDERMRVSRFIRQTATATTIHEAMHQLIFHTGIQSPTVHYPVWASEGLASAFETDEPRSAFGPDQEYPHRQREFQTMLRDGALLPLRDLVALSRLTDAPTGTAHAVYHQSYALVTWMDRVRRAQLDAYLEAMRRRAPGRLSATEHRRVFETAFGPIEALERAWMAYERGRLKSGR